MLHQDLRGPRPAWGDGPRTVRDAVLEAGTAGEDRDDMVTGMELEVRISEDVIRAFPDVAVTGFLAWGLRAAGARLADPADRLAEARARVQAVASAPAGLAEKEPIASWRSAIRRCGLKASSVWSSPEQLARRLLKDQPVTTPLPIVTTYCAVSARWLAPLGAYDLTRLAAPCVTLRTGRPGTDCFVPLGSSPDRMPITSEVVVYAAGDQVLSWAFNHRDSEQTCLLPETDAAVFFSEAVAPCQEDPMEMASAELRQVLSDAGAVTTPLERVDASRPSVSLKPAAAR
jgi:DNA/RNA-binding domain of Phe-tRNA-synthetase-like protein